jgi:hypothetical protein
MAGMHVDVPVLHVQVNALSVVPANDLSVAVDVPPLVASSMTRVNINVIVGIVVVHALPIISDLDLLAGGVIIELLVGLWKDRNGCNNTRVRTQMGRNNQQT